MGSTSYNSKLRDARWQRKRLEVMQRDEFACKSCGAKEDDGITLNVHHAYYIKGKNPWEYPDSMLITWCEKCHEMRHELTNRIQQNLLTYNIRCARGAELFTRDYQMCLSAISCSPLPPDYALEKAILAGAHAYDAGLEDGGDA